MLRRDTDDLYANRSCATIDTQFRHTVDIGLCGNFDRGARYRSSLQDVSTGKVCVHIRNIVIIPLR